MKNLFKHILFIYSVQDNAHGALVAQLVRACDC